MCMCSHGYAKRAPVNPPKGRDIPDSDIGRTARALDLSTSRSDGDILHRRLEWSLGDITGWYSVRGITECVKTWHDKLVAVNWHVSCPECVCVCVYRCKKSPRKKTKYFLVKVLKASYSLLQWMSRLPRPSWHIDRLLLLLLSSWSVNAFLQLLCLFVLQYFAGMFRFRRMSPRPA